MSFTFTAPTKDPSAVLRYGMNWTPWLNAGETIQAGPTVVSNKPDILVVDQLALESSVVSWRAAGGLNNKEYLVTVTVVTNQGRTDQRTVKIPVTNR
jgi:hypothetical protein